MKESNDSALYLAWVFFKSNLVLSFATLGILFVLLLLCAVPIVNIIAIFALTFVFISIGAFFAKKISSCNSAKEMAEIAKKTTIKEFLLENIFVAIGAYLGSIVIMLLISIVLGVIFGVAANGFNEMFYSGKFSIISFIATIIGLVLMFVFFYIYPAVMGEAYLSNSFGEAFKKFFLFFNVNFWKKTFNVKYMILISIWMMVFPTALTLSIFLTFVIVGILLLYILMLYTSGIYAYAYNIVHSNEQFADNPQSGIENTQN
jgi:hypothetical protein